jgi:hypothetical protein
MRVKKGADGKEWGASGAAVSIYRRERASVPEGKQLGKTKPIGGDHRSVREREKSAGNGSGKKLGRGNWIGLGCTVRILFSFFSFFSSFFFILF